MHKRLDALDLLRKGLGAGGLSSLPPLWEGKGGGKGLLVDAFPSNGSHKDPKYWGGGGGRVPGVSPSLTAWYIGKRALGPSPRPHPNTGQTHRAARSSIQDHEDRGKQRHLSNRALIINSANRHRTVISADAHL